MKQPILQIPDVRLRVVAVSFPLVREDYHDSHFNTLVDLRDTFAETRNCIGLAATQLGCPWRAIIVSITEQRHEIYLMVNPIIIKTSRDQQMVNDGCKSVMDGSKRGYTKRPKRITVEWVDPRNNAPRKQKFSGLIAAAIHHEIDHLNGVIFLDRLPGGPLA